MNVVLGLVLSLLVAVGFPTLPPMEKLVGQNLLACPTGILDLGVYQTQEKPLVYYMVYRDPNAKLLAVQILVNDEFYRIWILKDGKVLEFSTPEDLLKVSQSPCDLLPNPQVAK